MKLTKLLDEYTAEIQKAWLEKTLATYPKDSFGFLMGQKDQFSNPVGATHTTALAALVQLIAKMDSKADYRPPLVEVVKIRSIQDFSHVEAVSFVLLLKDIARTVLKKEIKDSSSMRKDLVKFDAAVDQMLLQAFEVYSDLRERLYKIRVDEVKRNVATLIKRTGFFEE